MRDLQSISIINDIYYMSILHKVLRIDVRETYVPQSLDEKYTAAITTGAASQFIFNILIFLIFISKSLSALELWNPNFDQRISISFIALAVRVEP